MEFLDAVYLSNSLRQWLLAGAVALAVALGVSLALWLVRGRLAKLAGRTRTDLDDIALQALRKTTRLFHVVVAVRAGSLLLVLPATVHGALRGITAVVVIIQIGLWVSEFAGEWIGRYTARRLQADRGAATTMAALAFAIRVALWLVVLLVVLDNFGVNITTFITGLGVGGIAVALAVQNVLGDLFASLSIVLDKPFVLGDALGVDEHTGTVEHIGLKTTRLRSVNGEQLIFSNSDLLKSRIRNYGRMPERRVVFETGVTYDTPREKLARIPAIMRDVVAAQRQARFDRSHFKTFGDFALKFETVYFVTTPDYNVHMDVLQAVNLMIHERFGQEGIAFAYPTQTLLVRQEQGS